MARSVGTGRHGCCRRAGSGDNAPRYADCRGSRKGRGYEGWQVGQGIGRDAVGAACGQAGNEPPCSDTGPGGSEQGGPSQRRQGRQAFGYGPDSSRESVPRLTRTAADGEMAPSWPVAGRLRPWGSMRAFLQRNAPSSWSSWPSVPKGRMWWLVTLAVQPCAAGVPSPHRLGRADCLAGAACWWSGTAA